VVEAEQTGKGNQMTVTNRDRAEWAAAALRHFQSLTGTEHADSLGDLLCDLMHFADANNFDFKAALARARGHYAEEFFEKTPPSPPPTPYMATFNTPAGIATELFHANSPEEALQQARKYADDPQLTEVDIEPLAEGYNVREIIITDEHGNQHSVWQTDEYRLQLAAPKLLKALESQVEATHGIIDAWDEMDSLPGVVHDIIEGIEDIIDTLEGLSEAARGVLIVCEHENRELAAAVSDLQGSVTLALKTITDAKGGAA
jgi:hypothetical protein